MLFAIKIYSRSAIQIEVCLDKLKIRFMDLG